MKFHSRHLLLATVGSLLLGVLPESQAGSRFHIAADIARFRGDSTRVYVEVYYSFDVSTLTFIRSGDTWGSEVGMEVYFKRSANDSIMAHQKWRIPFSTPDSSLLNSSRSYVDVVAFLLKPDIYRLYLAGGNSLDARQRDSISVALDLKAIERNQMSLSDVELCSSIIAMEKDSVGPFIKNTYEVKPNPPRIFGAGVPVIFYYLEEYNLLKHKSPNYYTRVTVVNSVGKEVVSHERVKSRINESNVEVGTLKVNALRTGSYTFNFAIIDSVDNSSFTSSKKFFVYNPNLPMDTITTGTQGSVMASEYAAMSEPEVDKEIAEIRYLAKREELAQFKNVKGLEAKRKLLFDFWNKRDEDASTPGNTQKSEYFKRIDYANEHFKSSFREGWQSDRGRVFVVYGPPDEVERHANEVDIKPYEIWTYNSIQGGVIFVFGDRSGFSDYVLLHSTHRDELHDENWMSELRMN